MNTSSFAQHKLLDLLPPGDLRAHPASPYARLLVLVGAHAASHTMLTFAALLARRGPLRVLDCGNRFNAHVTARALRSQGETNLSQALARIQVARAFTCYQALVLLEEAPAQNTPTLALDLLDTFYDESAPLSDRLRLAQDCSDHLRRLSQGAPVVASLRPPRPPKTDPSGLQEIIQSAADLLWYQEVPNVEPPPRLF